MRAVVALLNRELLALFCSPVAYVVIAGFLLTTGIVATAGLGPGQPASLAGVFRFTPLVLAFILPAITMWALSEEYRSGTIEPLLTAPISDMQLVLGKYLAAFAFYIIMLATTLAYLLVLRICGNPDLGAALAAYCGLLLLGAAFLAVGLLASSLTPNQIVAWMVAAIPLTFFVWFAGYVSMRVEGLWRDLVRTVDVNWQLERFNDGQVTTQGLVLFVAATAYFLFLTVKVVESRRWR